MVWKGGMQVGKGGHSRRLASQSQNCAHRGFWLGCTKTIFRRRNSEKFWHMVLTVTSVITKQQLHDGLIPDFNAALSRSFRFVITDITVQTTCICPYVSRQRECGHCPISEHLMLLTSAQPSQFQFQFPDFPCTPTILTENVSQFLGFPIFSIAFCKQLPTLLSFPSIPDWWSPRRQKRKRYTTLTTLD